MTNDFDEFLYGFTYLENALQMRTLKRWNGRDLLHKENLSEHTHLVVAVTIQLYDLFHKHTSLDFERLIKAAMLHDALEVLRGDILSVTKNIIPGLRKYIDDEEDKFITKFVPDLQDVEKELIDVADSIACYEFIKLEYERPHNDFTNEAYLYTKNVADNKYKNFYDKYIKR